MTTIPETPPTILQSIGRALKTIFSKTYFPRFIIMLIVIAMTLILMFNIKYNKKDGLQWRPAGEININKKVGKQ